MKIFRKGQGAFIKITSLAIGLTVGLVLIARVELNRNYDRCIINKERVYQVSETFQKQGEDANEYENTPGGAIPAMCRYIPEIEVGTRWTYQFTDEKIITEDGQRYSFEHSVFADSCFFDIFGAKILQGDAKKILSTPGQCLISKRLYDRLTPNPSPIGEGSIYSQGKERSNNQQSQVTTPSLTGRAGGGSLSFTFMAAPDKPMTIAGVFEDYDENSSFRQLDIVMSLPSIGTYSYDGTGNLMGNDRYHSFVRLRADADMGKVTAGMNKMLKEQIPWDDVKAAGIEDFGFRLKAVSGSHMQKKTVRTTCIILSVVAIVMLFTAVMNYILVVISLLVGRARQVALRKVLGAPRREFYLTTLKEATVHLLIALFIMALLLAAGQNWIRDLLGASVTTLFSSQTCSVLIAVCLVVLLCCGLLPGYIYSRIPTAYAYRLYSESKRAWKLSLLAFQFVLSTMLLCILTTIYRQYDYMLNKDLGYEYKDVAYIEIANPSDSTFVLAREIEKLPCVESTSTAYSLWTDKQSGNNVMLPGKTEQLFNFSCLYWAESSIVETMGLKVVQGTVPQRIDHPGWGQEAIVDEGFAEMLRQHTGWSDVVGQTILSTEFGDKLPLTIRAVVKNFTVGTLIGAEERPAMMINGNIYAKYILVKLNTLTQENLLAVQQVCDRLYPDAELNVKRYRDELAEHYMQTRQTRDLIVIGCLASLIITLIGLIGYVRDEVQRRSRELAIRKVMGATARELQQLFLRIISLIAVPSIIIGVALGWYLSTLLMEQFADKVPLSLPVFVLCAILVLCIIAAVVYMQTRRVANSNPVEYLKTE